MRCQYCVVDVPAPCATLSAVSECAVLFRSDNAPEERKVTTVASRSAIDVQVGGQHYKDMAIQPITYIMANGITFIEGNVIKYVSRWKKKGGVQDLKKARHMLDVLIENEELRGLTDAAT